jgi:hypothetical protein
MERIVEVTSQGSMTPATQRDAGIQADAGRSLQLRIMVLLLLMDAFRVALSLISHCNTSRTGAEAVSASIDNLGFR